MLQVFLSYSTRDHFFAELAAIELAKAEITVWRDQRRLRAGMHWQQEIERGISDSIAILVALSSHSAESAYVTYEWAYGLGKGRPIVPLMLTECNVHPRLRSIQSLDFSVPGALPWEILVERIKEIESDGDMSDEVTPESATPGLEDPNVKAILAYLNQRGYQAASFERIQKRIDPELTAEKIQALIEANPNVFKCTRLKDGRPGLKKLVP
jgi:hypothetical protein